MTNTRGRPEAGVLDSQRQASGPATRLIRKVLVANRGEIACRVMRTCRAMGIATVAVFSDADANARHVYEADEAVRIGESAASASYLNIPTLIAAARRVGADAVHPGYGFLAENAAFAAACREAGVTFIGPTPEVIARMGSKREAKTLMAAAGVPVVPGYEGADQSETRFLAAAEHIGYPLLVKASAGGGGKGMRSVAHAAALPEALAAARREALAAFGDDTLLLEKLIAEPRHVEFQIFGDAHGHIIHLGERECSIQRRHQKVIEESPSTALTPELRARMGAAAITVGRQLSYTNAGTVEFILDPAGNFYFLEVNTRLQVEHPVTELVTGLDLVRWQILVAEGQPLPLAQEQVAFQGHAVEARVYAEDPVNHFLPATGKLALWREPRTGRVDAGVQSGDSVSPYYDPMLAKITAHGADRAEALRRLDRALADTTLFGVRNNLDFLRRVLLHPAHVAGRISTAFIERHAGDLLPPSEVAMEGVTSVGAAALVAALTRMQATPDPRRWRNNSNQPIIERYVATSAGADQTPIEVRLTPDAQGHVVALLTHGERAATISVIVHASAGADLDIELDSHRVRATALEVAEHEWWVKVGDSTHGLRWRSPLPSPEERHADAGSLAAPMPGQIIAVFVEEGQPVRAGDALVVLEAMKMEHTVRAPHDGIVAGVRYQASDQVAAATVLLDVRPSAEVEKDE